MMWILLFRESEEEEVPLEVALEGGYRFVPTIVRRCPRSCAFTGKSGHDRGSRCWGL